MRGAPEILSWSAGDARSRSAMSGPAGPSGPSGLAGPAGLDNDDVLELGDLRALGRASEGDARPGRERRPRRSGLARVPRATWWLVAAGVAAMVVVPALRSPGHGPARPVPDGGSSRSAFVIPSLARPQSLPDQMTLAALDTTPLRDRVRFGSQGDCPILKVGSPAPVKRAMKAINAVLPTFQLLDSSRTIDQFSGLCLVQLRATNGQGTVLVLIVMPPNVRHPLWQPELLSMQSSADEHFATTTASDLTSMGWQVSVGAVGPPSVQPNMSDLEQISASKSVLW